jgi:hypothetical protein
MSAILLSAHVLLAILAVGPIAVAASIFPRYVETPSVARASHRICVTYAAVAVPLLGVATAVAMGVLTQVWVLVSIALTVVAAGVLVVAIVPAQRVALDGGGVGRPTTQADHTSIWRCRSCDRCRHRRDVA